MTYEIVLNVDELVVKQEARVGLEELGLLRNVREIPERFVAPIVEFRKRRTRSS